MTRKLKKKLQLQFSSIQERGFAAFLFRRAAAKLQMQFVSIEQSALARAFRTDQFSSREQSALTRAFRTDQFSSILKTSDHSSSLRFICRFLGTCRGELWSARCNYYRFLTINLDIKHRQPAFVFGKHFVYHRAYFFQRQHCC